MTWQQHNQTEFDGHLLILQILSPTDITVWDVLSEEGSYCSDI